MPTTPQAQAALEQAVANALLLGGAPGGNPYPPSQCRRMFDGSPPPASGNVFVAVWSEGDRRAEGRVSLNEVLHVNVTVTVRCVRPFDQWVIHRDDLENRLNTIRDLIHKDCWNFSIVNAANTLAAFDQPSTPVGFREGLRFSGLDRVLVVGPDWFNADPTGDGDHHVGLAQTARFVDARRVQSIPTEV